MLTLVTIFILTVILLICINSIFSFKNYNLVIWRNKGSIATIRYIFDGWTDQKQRQLFHGSIVFLETEASAGRTTPSLKGGGICRLFTNLPEIDGVGTQVGSVIEIEYVTTAGSSAKFEDFFAAVGIAVHRADPFIKPVKTIWQVIKEKLRY